ncbi:MAG: hypothetical protein HFG70_07625 [Hungatella sp.]|nr:hypothetical protein [Hungatella sp.]
MTKRQKRAAMIAAQRALVNNAKSACRELTEEENAQFESLQAEIDSLTREIEEEESGQGHGVPGNTMQSSGETGQDIAARAVETERQRVQDITAICREFQVDALEHIRQGHTMDQVREAILEELKAGGAPIAVRVMADEGDKFRDAATDGLLMRSNIPVHTQPGDPVPMRGMSLRDLGIECLSREGRSANELLRMDKSDLYAELCRQFYNPSAAFPAIMDNTIRKSIVHLYNQVPTTFQEFTTKGSLSDFKDTKDHEYVIGGVGDFLKVPENGEIKADIPKTDMLPSRKLETYGKQFSMTRQAFINDDIGFITEIPGLYAARAKKTIDKQVYVILFNNDKIFDKKELFSKDHKNLEDKGSKPTQTSIQSIILLMQGQTDQFGEAIYITPRTIVLPMGYEFDMAVILRSTQVTGAANNDINPLHNYPLKVVQSPVLNVLAKKNPCPWFMFADPSSARGIQVDYLNGQETPTVRRMEAPGTLGFTWDIFLDWGISVRDYRGMAKNPGVPIG